MHLKKGDIMDLRLKDLNSEQYEKILDFSKKVVDRKYYLTIFQDSCCEFIDEIGWVFDKDEIEDVKILNCLKDYTLCEKYEVKNEEYFDKDELEKDGYELYYAEATIHSGIWLYEYSGKLRDRWDSGIAGIIAIKHNSKDVHFGHKVFKDFLEIWQKCTDGDFYGYRIEDNFGEDIDYGGGFWDVEKIKERLPEYITDEQFKKACDNIVY